jgi:hypothetical protein
LDGEQSIAGIILERSEFYSVKNNGVSMKLFVSFAAFLLAASLVAGGVIEHKSCEIWPNDYVLQEMVEKLKLSGYTVIKTASDLCKFWCGLVISYEEETKEYTLMEYRNCGARQCTTGRCYWVDLWQGSLEDLPTCTVVENKGRGVYKEAGK